MRRLRIGMVLLGALVVVVCAAPLGVAGAADAGTAPIESGEASVNSVSCPSAGNCAAGGDYTGTGDVSQAFVVSERNGIWGKAIQVAGTAPH